MWTTPSGVRKQPSDKYAQVITEKPEDFRVLERVPLDPASMPIKLGEPQDVDTTIVILDMETTGQDSADSVIELGMIRCRYDADGRLSSVDELLDMFEDPGKPIPPEITNLTGITDGMVSGRHIDEAKVRDMLRDEPTVVAHNAEFDRPFFEKMFPNSLPWACSMAGIPWRERGHDSAKLAMLLEREGWFFDAHRAHMDCLATAWLLHVVPGSLRSLLEPSVKIIAHGSTYDVKDVLKARGYRWNPVLKHWWTVRKENNDELAYLKRLYPSGYMATAETIEPRTAFK